MSIYTELRKHVELIENLNTLEPWKVLNAFSDDQKKFLLHAIPQMGDMKKTTKILDGCIKNEVWGMVSGLISDHSSYKGVDTTLINNFDNIPDTLKPAILSAECLGIKWTNTKLNELFIDSLIKWNEITGNKVSDDETDVTVFYPLGWNESIESAVNNPCWCRGLTDAIGYCMITQLYYYKKNKLGIDPVMFGLGELHGVNTIKTRILSASISKKDILAELKPNELYRDSMNANFIIQNKAVFDITELPYEDVENGLLDFIETCIPFDEDADDEDIDDKEYAILDEIINDCKKAGLPEALSSDLVKNKLITEPNEIAQLLRVRASMKQGEAIRIAKKIWKAQKNATWVYGSSKGYKAKIGYFYRGLCYSSYKNMFFVAICKYNKEHNFGIITDPELSNECKGYMDILALDYSTESKTYEDCFEKCQQVEESDKKSKTDPEYKIEYVKEELSSEEKEAIKNQYREEVDTEYQKEIQIHKDSADSKANELEILKIKYEKLLRENEDLKKQLDKKQSILDKQNDVSVLSMGNEKEKYDGETHAMVLSAIRHELKNCDRDTRRYDVLESVLEKNMDDNDPISEKLTEIKKIAKGYRIASEMKPGLIKQGFQYTEDGRHPKIQYPDDDRYIITAASTTSDTRAGENLYALIKKKFF